MRPAGPNILTHRFLFATLVLFMGDEAKPSWHKFRDAISQSAMLLQQNENQQALGLVEESIIQAIREGEASWVRTLSHHAAIICRLEGDLHRVEHHYRQSLAFVPENPAALYGLADLARERGEVETSRQFATRCYRAIVNGNDEIARKGLLDLVLKHWPEVVE